MEQISETNNGESRHEGVFPFQASRLEEHSHLLGHIGIGIISKFFGQCSRSSGRSLDVPFSVFTPEEQHWLSSLVNVRAANSVMDSLNLLIVFAESLRLIRVRFPDRAVDEIESLPTDSIREISHTLVDSPKPTDVASREPARNYLAEEATPRRFVSEVDQLRGLLRKSVFTLTLDPKVKIGNWRAHRVSRNDEGAQSESKDGSVELHILERRGMISGALWNRMTNRVVLPRDGVSIEDIASELNTLHRHTLIQAGGGSIVGGTGEGYFRFQTLRRTPYEPTDSGPKVCKPFRVPKDWKDRRVRTESSDDDSFGKARWRATLKSFAETVFPDGADALPDDGRVVVCFPGLGEEALLWKSLGFNNEDLVFIEKDEVVAKRLQADFPGAQIVQTDFKARGIIDSLRGAIELAGGTFHSRAIAALSVDPYDRLTAGVQRGVRQVLETFRLSKDVMVAVNFPTGRETKKHWARIAKLVEKAGLGTEEEFMKLSFDERRKLGMNALITDHFKTDRPNFARMKAQSGKYEGNSTTRMFWAMHHYRKTPQD